MDRFVAYLSLIATLLQISCSGVNSSQYLMHS